MLFASIYVTIVIYTAMFYKISISDPEGTTVDGKVIESHDLSVLGFHL